MGSTEKNKKLHGREKQRGDTEEEHRAVADAATAAAPLLLTSYASLFANSSSFRIPSSVLPGTTKCGTNLEQ